MFSIKDKVSEYSTLRNQAKIIKERMDSIAKDIKTYLTNTVQADAKGSYYSEDDNFIFGNQAKKSIKLNEERAVNYFTGKGILESVTDTKIVINEDKVSKLVEQGVISQEDLETLVDTKVTYSIDIKEKKKEEAPVEVQVVASTKPKRKLPTRK